MKVCVLGEGAWGTAIASLLADNGITVNLWCYDPSNAQSISKTHINKRYFPDYILSNRISATASIEQAVADTDWIFEAVPVQFLRQTVESLKKYVRPGQGWVVLSKGIETDTLLLPSQIIADVLQFQFPLAALLGPSFAHEVMAKKKTAVDLICQSQLKVLLSDMFVNDYFKIYDSSDLIGAQLCGAAKNVIAFVVGIAEGIGYGQNFKAFLLTQALQQMRHLLIEFGAQQETAYSLAGLGDLLLTATSVESKNYQTGKLFAQGMPLKDIAAHLGQIPESPNTIRALAQLTDKKKLKVPFLQAAHGMLYQSENCAKALYALFNSYSKDPQKFAQTFD